MPATNDPKASEFAALLTETLIALPQLEDPATRQDFLLTNGLDRRTLSGMQFDAPLTLFGSLMSWRLEAATHEGEGVLETVARFIHRLIDDALAVDEGTNQIADWVDARLQAARDLGADYAPDFPPELGEYRRQLDFQVGILNTGYLGENFPDVTRIEPVYVPLPLDARLMVTIDADGDHQPEIVGVTSLSQPVAESDQALNSPRLAAAFARFQTIAHGGEGSLRGEMSRSVALAPILSAETRHMLEELTLEDAIHEFRRLLVTGGPGAGKSTAARALVADLLHVNGGASPTSSLGLVPAFLSVKLLTRWSEFVSRAKRSDSDVIEEYILSSLPDDPAAREELSRLNREGELLLVVDGLDEVWVGEEDDGLGIDRTALLTKSLQRHFARHPKSYALLTARPEAESMFRSSLAAHGFHSVRLATLTADYAAELAARFLRLSGTESDEVSGARFREIWATEGSTVLAAPLYVALFAAAISSAPGTTVRLTKSALLGRALNLVALRWSASRTPEPDEDGAERPLLSTEASKTTLLRTLRAIALHNVALGEETREGAEVGSVLAQLRVFRDDMFSAYEYLMNESGLLQEVAGERFEFRLRQFEEYLAGAELAESKDLKQHLGSIGQWPQRWLEPLGIAAELKADLHGASTSASTLAGVMLVESKHQIDNPWPFLLGAGVVIDRLLDDYGLAADDPTCTVLRARVAVGYPPARGFSDPIGREFVGRLVSRIGDDRLGVGVDQDGTPVHRWISIPAHEQLIGLTDEEKVAAESEGWSQGWNYDAEQPAHPVFINEFAISKYPVTVLQFVGFCGASDGYLDARWWEGLACGVPTHLPERKWREPDASHPVSDVNWYEAIAYTRWLSHRSNQSVRLPTEVEWEYAARGQRRSRFAWGDAYVPMACNGLDAGLAGPCTVGIFRTESADESFGPDGPEDMSGNVWEWCSTTYGESDGDAFPYPYDPDDGREDLERGEGFRRIVRGGSFTNVPSFLRLTIRGYDRPGFRVRRQGFRVVRDTRASS
jgi:formylglycine-generating enzyme required for sulfatase activity